MAAIGAAAAAALLLGAVIVWRVAVRQAPGQGAAAAPAAGGTAVPAGDLALLAGTQVHFATVEEGRAVLEQRDDWMQATGELQRAALMQRPPPVTLDDFARWQGDNVRAWPAKERARWERALAQVAPAINRLHLPLPARVLLVDSTGRESADTPHTRGAAIVLPEGTDPKGFSDGELLAHELFHVATRHSPALATRVYAELGFEPVGELQWPAAWARLRIADQDAATMRHAMQVRVGGQPAWVMPVVVAAKEQPDRARGETVEHLMQTRLLQVQPGRGGAPTTAVLAGGQPVWHRIEDVPDYLEHLGGNTDYVLHVEEAAADNFMMLVARRAVPNPGLLQRIEAAIVKGSGASSAPG